jgi:hypothetical protein
MVGWQGGVMYSNVQRSTKLLARQESPRLAIRQAWSGRETPGRRAGPRRADVRRSGCGWLARGEEGHGVW